MIIWVIAGLLGLATGLRIGWALVNKQSLVSTAMILALGSLGLVAALNWQPLTLLLDTLLHWPNISMGLSQVALIACAAGSCVMITTVSSARKPATIRRIAIAQYSVAAVIAVVSMVTFFAAGQQPEMSPEEYLKRNLGSAGTSLPWLLPLLYVLLALTLVSWAGLRHSNRSRRGRALFVFTVGIVLIVLASAFFFLRAVGTTQLRRGGRGRHAARLRHAGGRRRVAAAQRRRLVRRPPRAADHSAAAHRTRPSPARRRNRGTPARAVGVPGGRADVADLRRIVPRGQCGRRRGRRPVDAVGALPTLDDDLDDVSDIESPSVPPEEQARAIAEWIYAGREERETTAQRARSRAWVGCASRGRTPTANGSWRSRSSTEMLDRQGTAAGP